MDPGKPAVQTTPKRRGENLGGGVGLEGAVVEGGKGTERVEVVTPLGDFAVLDGHHRDVSVAVGVTGGDNSALGGVLSTTVEVDGGPWVRCVSGEAGEAGGNGVPGVRPEGIV